MLRWILLVLTLSVLVPRGASGAPGPTFLGDAQVLREVQAAYEKLAVARTWRARMSMGAGMAPIETEFVAPDRQRLVTNVAGQRTEFIVIGQEMWQRTPGACWKMPARIPITSPREAVNHGPDARITVAKGAPETVDGTTTQTYLLTIDAQGKQVRQKMFVAPTGFIRRLEVPSDQGTAIIDFFDYDAAITINNPPC